MFINVMSALLVLCHMTHQSSSLIATVNHTPLCSPTSIRECPLEGKRIGRCARLVRLSRVEPPGGPRALWEAEAMEAMIECLMGPQKQRFLASVVVRDVKYLYLMEGWEEKDRKQGTMEGKAEGREE